MFIALKVTILRFGHSCILQRDIHNSACRILSVRCLLHFRFFRYIKNIPVSGDLKNANSYIYLIDNQNINLVMKKFFLLVGTLLFVSIGIFFYACESGETVETSKNSNKNPSNVQRGTTALGSFDASDILLSAFRKLRCFQTSTVTFVRTMV